MAFAGAMAGISALSSLAGGIGSFLMSGEQAGAQKQIAGYNATSLRQQEGWVQGQGATQAYAKQMQTSQLAGRAEASLAAGGVATNTGSALLLDTNILRMGAYQGNLEMASAGNQAKNLEGQARGDIYAGALQSYASSMQGDMSLLSGVGSAFGTASKYFDGKSFSQAFG